MRTIALATILTAGALGHATPAEAGGACFAYVRSDAQRRLVQRESGGNPAAANPTSTARGCGQLLRATRRHFGRRLGINPDTTSAAEQMRMMHAYVDDRYGSDERALAHSLDRGWY